MLHSSDNMFENDTKSGCSAKIEKIIWKDMDQKNVLNQAFHIIPENLRVLRIASLSSHLVILVWAFVNIPDFMLVNFWEMGANLGTWCLILNIFYLLFTFLFKKDNPYNLKWKITYIMGEISAAFGFFLVPFFFVYLLPTLLANHGQEILQIDLTFQSALHIVCPMLIWLDMFVNYYVFPKRHVKCLIIMMIIYGFSNFVWTIQTGHPVYPAIDWKSIESFILTTLSAIIIIFGYYCGHLQYKWKMRRETKSIVETLQMTEISTESQFSQYSPINYEL